MPELPRADVARRRSALSASRTPSRAGARRAPLSLHRSARVAETLGHLVLAEAPVEPAGDDLGLARVGGLEARERLLKRGEVDRSGFARSRGYAGPRW